MIYLNETAYEVMAVFVCFHKGHWLPLVKAIVALQVS
jgi:hypothetical protein